MKQSQISSFFKIPTSVLDNSHVRQQPAALVANTKQDRGEQPAEDSPSVKRISKHKVYEAKKRDRVWQENWLCSYNWLRYDKKVNVMYCEACREFVHLHPTGTVAMIKGKYDYYIFLLSKKYIAI